MRADGAGTSSRIQGFKNLAQQRLQQLASEEEGVARTEEGGGWRRWRWSRGGGGGGGGKFIQGDAVNEEDSDPERDRATQV